MTDAERVMAAMRHNWVGGDQCVKCGLRRDGYGGGRTGSLRYTDGQGHVRFRAGACPVEDWPLYKRAAAPAPGGKEMK